LLAEEGGPSPTMNRKSSDFESVTMVKDDATEAYGGKYQGWRDALVSIPSIYRPIEGLCISLSCVVSLLLPCCCHVVAMLLPCCCHVVAMLLPCCCHVVAMLLPCCCHVVAMLLPVHHLYIETDRALVSFVSSVDVSGHASRPHFEGRKSVRGSTPHQQRQRKQHGGELLPRPATDLFRLLRPKRVCAAVDVFGRRCR
jgi:hypothetical protein